MAINLNLKIEKKDLWIFSAVMIFLIGIGYIIAYNPSGSGDPSVMGHSYNELQTCPEGKILKISGGAWTCMDDNSGSTPALSCTAVNSGSVSSPGTVSCPSGTFVTGGGGRASGGGNYLYASQPYGNGWYAAGGSTIRVYAICCKI